MINSTLQAAVPAETVAFLRSTLPFHHLDQEILHRLALKTLIDFYPAGTIIARQDETEVTHLHIIQKGAVKLFLKDQDGEVTLNDFRGEGEYFGALPIIQGTRANLTVKTEEDTFCLLIPREDFEKLLASEPTVTRFFLRSLSEKMVKTAYSELSRNRIRPRSDGSLVLFNSMVGDVRTEPAIIASSESVIHAARVMADRRIGSLLVRLPDGRVNGIVTDKDLRAKVVARGLAYETPVGEIMATPLETIPPTASCFDALIQMMRKGVHHLAVADREEITGVITTHDIMVLQGTSPLYILREIIAQKKISGLYPLAKKTPEIIRALLDEGAKADNITRLITVLNDHLLERLLTMLEQEMGPPPGRYCWLLLGSEGRREQTFKTDQDNAIIFEDGIDDEAAAYFKKFAEAAIEHLVACGYPRCPGEVMASNPKWCKPLSVWQRYFNNWLTNPEPREVLHSTIFFDFRSGFGDLSLAENLRDGLAQRAGKEDIFLLHIARDCLEGRPPLSFFRNFVVEKDGQHKNTLDLKTRGLVPFVDFARLYSLKHSVRETNTIARLKQLAAGGHMASSLIDETIEAYEFIMHLRLVHQLDLISQGQEPDNHINPVFLSDLEKQTLKEAFAVIGRIQSHIKLDYQMGEI